MRTVKKYTKEEATQVVEELMVVVKKSMEAPYMSEDFVRQHPWATRYLSHAAEEAKELLRKVKTGMTRVVVLSTCQQKIYREETLVLFVEAPVGREILFRFEKQRDGSYIALDGYR